MRYELKSRAISETLDATFKLYRDNLKPLLGLAALYLIPTSLWQSEWLRVTRDSFKHLAHTTPADRVLLALGALALAAAMAWAGCAMACATADAYLGKPFTALGSVRRALGLMGGLLWTELLYWPAIFFGFLLLVIPGVYLTLAWSVWLPVLVVEGFSGPKALARSTVLTAGARARVGWLMTLFLVIQLAFGFGVAAFLPDSVRDLPVLGGVLQSLAAAALAPVYAALYTLIYFDGRIRHEAWDLEMQAKEVLSVAVPLGAQAQP